jgi:hypothetical protein
MQKHFRYEGMLTKGRAQKVVFFLLFYLCEISNSRAATKTGFLPPLK